MCRAKCLGYLTVLQNPIIFYIYFTVPKYLTKEHQERRVCLIWQFEGTVHYGSEERDAGSWAGWSHCIYNQEAERGSWILMPSPLYLPPFCFLSAKPYIQSLFYFLRQACMESFSKICPEMALKRLILNLVKITLNIISSITEFHYQFFIWDKLHSCFIHRLSRWTLLFKHIYKLYDLHQL